VRSSTVYDDLSTAATVGKGNELQKKGDYDKARHYYDTAIARNPTAYGPYVPRAIIFIRQQKWNLALQDLNTVMRLKPTFIEAAILRGEINQYLGNYDAALADYDKIVPIVKNSWPSACAVALNARAWLRATCPNAAFRNAKQAVSDAKGACNVARWSNWSYLDTLAAAFAGVGDFDSAIRFEKRAIERAPHDDTAKTPEEHQRTMVSCQKHLASYEQHRPLRDTAR
jgi:tetratricopeptide (TPR) repeat protein